MYQTQQREANKNSRLVCEPGIDLTSDFFGHSEEKLLAEYKCLANGDRAAFLLA